MGIKNEVEKFAAAKGIALRDYQKSNLRDIERDFENKRIEADKALSRISDEFKKEGKFLSSSEQSELKGKIK
ncbi:MAG: hypothetical protein WAV16_01565 [Candidatus Moraniibacteriota bacterium]